MLIITYYWPPSGGPGVQRVLKFTKYLPKFGWEPIVLTVKNGEYPAIDHSLEKEIAEDLKVYRSKTIEFYDLFRAFSAKKKSAKIETFELLKDKKNLSLKARIAQFIRLNLLIPDARLGWQFYAVSAGLKIIKKEKPQLIFSSSPPHSLQLIARKLAIRSGLPWIADFRDPWTQSFYDKGSPRLTWAERRNGVLEKKVVQSASALTSVSEGVLSSLPVRSHQKTRAIPNGYDAQDFIKPAKISKQFRIVYTGHAANTQNPTNLWQALQLLDPDIRGAISVDFYGSVDPSLHQSIHAFDLQDLVYFHPYVSHEEIVEIMLDASLLLLLIPKSHNKGILTGKLFEYLATRKRILGIGPAGGEAAQILEECNAGVMYDYDQDLTKTLITYFQEWEAHETPQVNEKAIGQYSRERLTHQLANLFEEICS